MKIGDVVAKLDQYRHRFGDHIEVRIADDGWLGPEAELNEVTLKHEMDGRGDPYILLE